MPSYTIGCASPEYCGAVPEPFSRVRHTPFSVPTFATLIAFSGEYRWLKRLPPLVGQLARGGVLSVRPAKSLAPVCAKPANDTAAAAPSTAARKEECMLPPRRRLAA